MLATWGTSTGRNPTLDLQFAGATSLDNRITFSRGSQATLFDSTGALVYAPNNVIRNNTMVGAVAGTPGTLPTNWFVYTPATGLTTSVVGTGTDNGISYIDVRVTGTASGGGNIIWGCDSNTGIAASNGQTWAQSTYLKIQGGTTTGIVDFRIQNDERSVSAYIRTNASSALPLTTAALNTQRYSFAATLSGGGTVAYIVPYVLINFTVGVAIDITLRIGMPQLELGSVATAVNATSGTAYYGPRFDYNPSTLAAQGLLIEEQRTNSIRNNTMQGTVAGTPGTLPTNWVRDASTTGLSMEVVGTGTDGGITYLDFRVFGTAAAANYYAIYFENAAQIVAANGETWTNSFYLKLAGGSTSGLDPTRFPAACINENTSAGLYVTGQEGIGVTPTSAWQRVSLTRTLNGGATVARVLPFILFRVNNGAAINITLRVGLPQMEQGAFATSVIPTTTTALTRNADVASMTGTNFSSWFNASEGTLLAQGILEGGTSGTFPRQAAIVGSNSNTDTIGVYWSASSGQMRGNITLGGVQQLDQGAGSNKTAGSSFKGAIAYKLNDGNFSSDGSVGSTDTSMALPTVQSLLIGGPTAFQPTASSWIQRISYYPVRLSNSTLQALTA